jgi:hypothetical protein
MPVLLQVFDGPEDSRVDMEKSGHHQHACATADIELIGAGTIARMLS